MVISVGVTPSIHVENQSNDHEFRSRVGTIVTLEINLTVVES